MRFCVEELAASDFELASALLNQESQATIDCAAEATKPWARLWATRDAQGELVCAVLTWWAADQVEVVQVSTAPDARRRGLARALLERLVQTATAAQVESLWLEVRHDNQAALGLYRSLGFVTSRRRPRYYADGTDAVEMTLALGAPR
jgi:ribosomal-protein-alanine N-acetyltransferase